MRKIYDLSIIRIRKNVFAFSEEYAEFLSKKKKKKKNTSNLAAFKAVPFESLQDNEPDRAISAK